ncbi:MAG: MarR family winged helix-turn-helix transcriptional regulator [Rhodoferax sp.]|nr:MarR family winged helix-turn-helix transcriptional regulator [Rhodoferax sp.]
MKKSATDAINPVTVEAELNRKRIEQSAMRTVELIYFAHIDQADCADHILAKHGIGRPHHRVMYFSNKKPGISVRELMALLRITNQALARTTNQLSALGYLEQRYNLTDRRIRQNFLTNKGAALLAKLTRNQVVRVAMALDALGPNGIDGLWRGLEALVRPQDLPWVLEHPKTTAANSDQTAMVTYLKRTDTQASRKA